MKKALFSLLVFAFCALNAQTIEQKSIAVTIYNAGIGVIKDVRSIDLNSGVNKLAITDVSKKIDPTSVHIKLEGEVLEQNYQYDLVSLDKILQKYINKDVRVTGDSGRLIEGSLLSSIDSQLVIQKKDGLLALLPSISKYQVNVDKLPEGLITQPTLVWEVNFPSKSKQNVELTYQTEGLTWNAEYVAVLNDKDNKVDLKAWVSIENNSGTSYKNAKLKLLAGDVMFILPIGKPDNMVADEFVTLDKKETVPEPENKFVEKPFFEYHVYDLQRPATINNNETKQISLFDVSDIPVIKGYFYKWEENYDDVNNVSIVLELENKDKNNLGIPMPGGKIRLYKSDGDAAEFIGEDWIKHTAKDEKIRLQMGDAFDIISEETLLEEKQITKNISETTDQLKLRNHKDTDVIVDVEKTVYDNWDVINSNFKYEKKDANAITFKIPVRKDSESILKTTIRYTQ
jgi:hypothetical protein